MVIETKLLAAYLIAVFYGAIFAYLAPFLDFMDSSMFIVVVGVASAFVGVIYHWEEIPKPHHRVAFGLASLVVPILALRLTFYFWESLFPLAAILSFGYGLLSFPFIKFTLTSGSNMVNRWGEAGIRRIEKTIEGSGDKDGSDK